MRNSSRPIDHEQIRRCLIVLPRALGDIVLATPLLGVLREHIPHCLIDVLAFDETADLLSGHPHISSIELIRARWGKRLLGSLWPRLALLRSLHRKRYDLLIQPGDGSWGPALVMMLGIRLASGAHPRVHRHLAKRTFWRLAFTHTPARPHQNAAPRHAVQTNLDLLRCLGIHPAHSEITMSIVPKEDARTNVRHMLGQHGLASRNFILLSPMASASGKSLGARACRELIKRLREAGMHIVIVAAPVPRELACVRAILGAGIEGVVDLAGTLDLGQLAAIAAEAACVVAMDSGTMHVAVGTGTPTVAIFGPGNEQWTGPFGSKHKVVSAQLPCRPCYRDGCGGSGVADCLDAIDVARMMEAVEAIMCDHGPPSPMSPDLKTPAPKESRSHG